MTLETMGFILALLGWSVALGYVSWSRGYHRGYLRGRDDQRELAAALGR